MGSDRTDKIGRQAEKLFEKFCLDSELTPTPPQYDENGWDFFVEFPPNRLPQISLDAQPAAIKFLCQVKATDNFDSKIDMNISHFNHLARTTLPAFLFVVDFDGQSTPSKTYLCHFDIERVAQTLKKIRELQASGKTDLNKHKMAFRIREDECFVSDEIQLGEKVLEYTGRDLTKYAELKSLWLKTVGFSEVSHILSIPHSVKVGELVDASLGISALKVEGLVVSEKRFGIPLKLMECNSGRLQISNLNPLTAQMVASSKKARRSCRVDLELLAPPFPGLPLEYRKIRLKNKFFDIRLYESGCEPEFDVGIDYDASYGLDELHQNIEFICLCANDDVQVEIHINGEQLAKLHDVVVSSDRALQSVNERLRLVRRFLTSIIWSKPIQIRARELLRQELQLVQLVAHGKGSVSFDFEEAPTLDIPKRGIFSVAVELRAANSSIFAFCHWVASARAEGMNVRLKLDKLTVWRSEEFGEDDVQRFESSWTEFNKFCQSLDKMVFSWKPKAETGKLKQIGEAPPEAN